MGDATQSIVIDARVHDGLIYVHGTWVHIRVGPREMRVPLEAVRLALVGHTQAQRETDG